MTITSATRRRFGVPLLVLAVSALTLGGVTIVDHASATPTVVFSDGFESGNSWSLYSNGTAPTQTVVSAPTHTGNSALQIAAGTDTVATDIGLADIKNVSFTEDESQLSFWYYASGGASFESLTVEVHTSSSAEFYATLPGGVTTGGWQHEAIMLSTISSSLAGASIASVVIKAVAAPNTGTADFTIDDVAITNGVTPPANLTLTSPATGATGVARDRVLTAFYDAPLDASSVSTSSVQLLNPSNTSVPIDVTYEVGQQAIALMPASPLAANTTYHVAISGVLTPAGAGTVGDQSWSFTTGASDTGDEQVFADNFASAGSTAPWTLYSNAPTNAMNRVHTTGSTYVLRATAQDNSDPFVVSMIRATNWLDENSTLSLHFVLSGTATPEDMIVAVTAAAGFTRFISIPLTSPGPSVIRTITTSLAAIDPDLVGQDITSVEWKVETSTPGTLTYTITNFAVHENLSSYLGDVDSAADPGPSTTTPPSTGLSSATIAKIRALATQIETAQQPDGSIYVGPTSTGFGTPPVGCTAGSSDCPYPDEKVDPYAANYAAMGLLRAYQVTGDTSDLTAADDWLTYYQDHLQPDGVDDDCFGYYPNCGDNHNQDSVDSYASTYLMTSLKEYSVLASAARSAYLTSTSPYVADSDRALDLVYQQDGTTIAKPSYAVRFGMDNSETYNGLVAASQWATAAGHPGQAALSRFLAARTLYSLRKRFDAPSPGLAAHVANAVGPAGSFDSRNLAAWYPDALSSVLMLAQVGQPTTADQTLFNSVVTQFDTNDQADRPVGETNTPQYMWWAQAALRVGEPIESKHFVDEYNSIENTPNPDPSTFAITAGHLIRVLAYPYDDSLWFSS